MQSGLAGGNGSRAPLDAPVVSAAHAVPTSLIIAQCNLHTIASAGPRSRIQTGPKAEATVARILYPSDSIMTLAFFASFASFA